jgi:lipopolysaccharide export system permease protein
MFMLIMQFLWKYIDDLMGKGLETTIILELLFYVSASLIPLALPLAILLSSIMTFGNLAENNELTALKSSGLSLYRIMRPLTFIVIGISLFTFYFANFVIPVANLKWHSLIYDIQNTKIAAILTPGVYSKELEGYSIKVDSEMDNSFKGILIHDHSNLKEIKTVRAESGKIYKSENGNFLYFELNNGYIIEELSPSAPRFNVNNQLHKSDKNNRPSRRSDFQKATYKINLTGFNLQRSEDDLFADKHEMLNVFQIYNAIDSVRINGDNVNKKFIISQNRDFLYLNSFLIPKDTSHTDNFNSSKQKDTLFNLKKLDNIELKKAIQTAQSKIRRKNQNISGQIEFLKGFDRDVNGYWIEFHRKFALCYAIVVLFFIGAPLGAIVKRGGFGAPVVIAALLFMIYFVLMSVGDSLANAEVVSPFLGMWFAGIALTPIAIYLTYTAANDRPIFKKINLSSLNPLKLFIKPNFKSKIDK